MSYKNQYSKYKNKYLELKNQFGGRFKYDDLKLPPTTIISFFEAILKFLNNYRYPELSYYQLLEIAGIKSTAIDQNTTDEQLSQYAEKIAYFYKINIQILTSERELKFFHKTHIPFLVQLVYNSLNSTYSLKHIKDDMDKSTPIIESTK